MKPICRSTRLSNIAALMLGLTLAACGGSPTGLEGERPALAAQDRASVHDNTKEVMAQIPGIPQDRVAAKTAAVANQPQASTSVGCALHANELVPFDAEAEAQQAPQMELALDELVPEPALEGVNDEGR